MRKTLEMALDWIEKQPEETPDSKYDLDTRYVVLREIEAALAQPEHDCTRSHPHEEMSKECELRTEIARLTNCLSRVNAQAEHFEREWYLRGDEIERLKAQPEQEPVKWSDYEPDGVHHNKPEQKPVAWKLVPIEPTRKMLEAMDECSIEGYDEHLYAGYAASVYMAAVDVAPTPPQPEKPDQDEVDIRSRLYQRIHELETQLAQPEQKPVAYINIEERKLEWAQL